LQNRGVEEERSDVVGLAAQHLLQQVVEDKTMAARELVHEAAQVPAPDTATSRQRRQLQTSRPPFGPGLQCSDLCWFEAEAHDLVEEPLGLLLGESEIGGSELDELTAGSQAGQRQRWVRAGRDGEGDLTRQVVQEERNRLVDGDRVNDVVVVKGKARSAVRQRRGR
jgi:hypothetical protein